MLFYYQAKNDKGSCQQLVYLNFGLYLYFCIGRFLCYNLYIIGEGEGKELRSQAQVYAGKDKVLWTQKNVTKITESHIASVPIERKSPSQM